MALDDGVADLHLHTTASDGTCSATARIEQARDAGLETIAITDHDTIADDLDGRVSHRDGIELVTGVEVRADIRDTKVELLGYYVDPSDSGLGAVLEDVRSYRRDRNRAIVDRLRSVSDFDRTYDELGAGAEGLLGRPHIADRLVADGIADSVGAAFETYLGAEGSAFVPMERVPAPTVIDAIHAAGGVASLAHPGRVRTDDIGPILDDLVDAGLDAIEVPYPYADAPSEGYVGIDSDDAAALADRYELLRTGGSDCHGPDSGKFRIGSVRVGREGLTALRERAATRRPL